MPNAAMARKILDITEKFPENFNMASWISYIDEDIDRTFGLSFSDKGDRTQTLQIMELENGEELNICNTTLCVSGWAVALDGWEFNRYGSPKKEGETFVSWVVTGMRILDITKHDADVLFGTTEARAKLALAQLADGADVIDWNKVDDDDDSYDDEEYEEDYYCGCGCDDY